MTGYVRIDTINNIADGNVINAADLDGEFNGVQAAFNSSTGHTHDGTASEGAPITKLGPSQNVTVSTTVLGVATTNTVDLGTSSLKFKDFYLAGAASIGGAITYGGVTLSNAVTGTGNMVLSASPTLTGTITAAAANFSGAVALNGNATIGDADTDTITQAASYVTGTQLKSAKTATNTLSLAAYDVDGTAYTNLITLTAANEPTLALTSTGVGTINNMSIGATTASTGAFTSLTASTTLGVTGVATFSAGTAALPAITTTGDTNTGIWFPAADTIAFTEGGVESMRIDSSGNLLVGATSADARVFAYSTTGTSLKALNPSNVAQLLIGFNNTSFNFMDADNNIFRSGNGTERARIESDGTFRVKGAGTAGSTDAFQVAGTAPADAARIDSSGNLLVGSTSVPSPVANYKALVVGGTTGGIVDIGTTSTSYGRVSADSVGLNLESLGATTIIFRTDATERARFLAAGGLQTKTTISVGDATPSTSGAGITFPATQSASSDANTLDDYEEGTWTPNQGVGLTVVGAFSSSGTYTKIGRQITITGTVAGATSVSISAGGTICTNCPLPAGSGNYAGSIFNAQTGLTGSQVWQQTSTVYNVAAAAAATSHVFTVTYFV